MKTFTIFLVVCGVAMTYGSMRLPTDLGGTMKQLGKNLLRNTIGLDIGDLDKFRDLYNKAVDGAAKDKLLGAAGASFFAKFKDGKFLEGKSRGQIISDYINNIKKILATKPDPSYQTGIDNEVLGLNEEEYQRILGTIPQQRQEGDASRGSDSVTSSRKRRQAPALPKSVDWRQKGAVTPVKNQGKCGSCWAFAAVGAMEGRMGVKMGQAPVLSEQNLIDCAKNVNGSKCCQGCDGGFMGNAYEHATINKGISSNASYPYEAKDATCRYDPNGKAGTDIVGWTYTEQDDEEDLKRAVAEGPVAVAVDANNWSPYKSGIFKCRGLITGMIQPLKINHGVTVVGYGSSFLGDFWIVKNSWGDSWGEKGYIRIARNSNNQCGIASQANYPLV